jgi:hypothetical protein
MRGCDHDVGMARAKAVMIPRKIGRGVISMWFYTETWRVTTQSNLTQAIDGNSRPILGGTQPPDSENANPAKRATVLRRSCHLCGLVVEMPEPHVMRFGRVRRIIDKNMYRKRVRL